MKVPIKLLFTYCHRKSKDLEKRSSSPSAPFPSSSPHGEWHQARVHYMDRDGENCLPAEGNSDQKVLSVLWTRGQDGREKRRDRNGKLLRIKIETSVLKVTPSSELL